MGWIADLPAEIWDETDANEAPDRCKLRLLEETRELGPAHEVHARIQEDGEGRYSFWTNVLYFSTSDGSDPNTNGRTYRVVRAKANATPQAVLRAITPGSYSSEWLAPERPFRCAVIGLGNRGTALTRLLRGFTGVEVNWLCDASAERVDLLRQQIEGAQGTIDLSVPLGDDSVDAVFVTLPDHLHRLAAEPAFGAGKHVFLEKPLATTVEDGKAILRAWANSGRVLQIGYVLRGAPFYQAIRNVIRQGRLGPVRIVSLSEQLDALHGASFMRRWHGQSSHSGGLIVHKACHDLDLVCWLLDTRPLHVASFGGASTFARPAPAAFCSECPERADCPYADNSLHERRTPAERADPTAYGLDRCVFRPDKDIVDNQVVSFELESGVRGSFHLAMQGPHPSERWITVIGDEARLDGVLETGRFMITYTRPEQRPVVWTTDRRDGHGGGDLSTVATFLNACLGRIPPQIKSAAGALRSLVFASAAEQARRTCSVVTLGDADFDPDNHQRTQIEELRVTHAIG